MVMDRLGSQKLSPKQKLVFFCKNYMMFLKKDGLVRFWTEDFS